MSIPNSLGSFNIYFPHSQKIEDGQIFDVLEKGGIEELRVFLDHSADLNVKNKDGQAALHLAVEQGYSKAVRLLIEKGADVNVKNDTDKETPLHSAIKSRDAEMVKLLIQSNADLTIHNEDDSFLMCAINFGDIETLRSLIEAKVDVNAVDGEGASPLWVEISEGRDLTVIETLIDAGADVNFIDNEGNSLLHNAIQMGSYEITRLLVDRGGALLDVENNEQKKPLFFAVMSGNLELTEYLISKGAKLTSRMPVDCLVEFNAMLINVAASRDNNMRAIILEQMLSDNNIALTLRPVKKAIEKEELKKLHHLLLEKNHPDLQILKSKKNEIAKAIKSEKDEIRKNKRKITDKIKATCIDETEIEGLAVAVDRREREIRRLTRLIEKKREEIKPLKDNIANALKLYRQKDFDGVKKCFNVKEQPVYNSIMCAYFVGQMATESSEADFEPIIESLVNNIDLKDSNKHRVVFLITTNLFEFFYESEMANKEKIEVLKKIFESPDVDLKAMSMVAVLAGLEEVALLKGLAQSPQAPQVYLKSIMKDLLVSRFYLEGVENIAEKYEQTFGKFRNEEAVFIYLEALNSDESYSEMYTQSLSTYVRNVLNGEFLQERYNIDKTNNRLHLGKIFRDCSELFEMWKKEESLPVAELVPEKSYTLSEISYLEVFRRKIITDNHLGVGWKGRYPGLFKGLSDESLIEGVIRETDSEAERQLLLLCRNHELTKADQKDQLKKNLKLFKGTEFANDLKALLRSISLKDRSEVAPGLTICNTVNPCDVLLLGDEILGSCQRLDGEPKFNRGLLGPLLDGKYRLIAIKDASGRMIARCLLKILIDKKTGKPVLFQERLYINQQNNTYHAKLLNEMCLRKARSLGAPEKAPPSNIRK
jgi:ankyrin repeat protein